MGTTTMGVKLDEATRDRIKSAAQRIDRTPHWLIKQAIFNYLERLESGTDIPEIPALAAAGQPEADDIMPQAQEESHQPFLDFAEQILPQSVTRAAITAAYRRPETEAVPMLLEQARLPADLAQATHKMAYGIAEKLRNQKSANGRAGMVQGLLQEFSLSSQEGVALMCLAEALLRIPDKPTRDALIRDKISNGNWHSHLGRSPSLFVNAATWGLLFTGKLVSTHNEANLSRSLNRIIGKSGEPLIRKGVDMAMRLMGEQFVTGETIAEALANARKLEEKGFRYSYDMLGEAALTEADAQAYLVSYQQAIHAIGKASNGRGIYEGPGISIKLSALHPRYSRAQYERVMEELYPRLLSLTLQARQYDIGINIDAEEADRLEISLDLLEKLCFEPQLAGWNGIGFVIQAYQKRCPFAIDAVIDMAQRSRRRLMIRLVKGAYWDSEMGKIFRQRGDRPFQRIAIGIGQLLIGLIAVFGLVLRQDGVHGFEVGVDLVQQRLIGLDQQRTQQVDYLLCAVDVGLEVPQVGAAVAVFFTADLAGCHLFDQPGCAAHHFARREGQFTHALLQLDGVVVQAIGVGAHVFG